MQMDDNDVITIIVNSFLEQYGAAFKTLDKLIDLCPDNLWSGLATGPEIYKILYHTMYFADLYLSSSKEESDRWTPKFSHAENFGTSKENFHPKEWKRPLSKEELIEYLHEIRVKTQEKIENLSLDQLSSDSIFEWHGSSLCSSLIYNLRHIMQHNGALQARLRISGIEGRFWVSKSPIISE